MSAFEIKPVKGSSKNRKRIGRGTGNGTGKTCGKGHKGQKCRSGGKLPNWFEGGQMPLYRRIPKKGFKSLNKVYFNLVNLSSLNDFKDGEEINADVLKKMGLIKSNGAPVKILARGELTAKNLNIIANAASKKAIEAVSLSGGSVKLI